MFAMAAPASAAGGTAEIESRTSGYGRVLCGDTCGYVDDAHNLWMWGKSEFGAMLEDSKDHKKDALGWSYVTEPTLVMRDVEGVTANQAGWGAFAAVKTDGSLWTWGNPYYSQRGVDYDLNAPPSETEPTQVFDSGVASVSFGFAYAAALKTDGSLWTWGENQYGECGYAGRSDTPVKVMDDVASVSVGLHTTAVVKKDGSLWAWGAGELGNGKIGSETVKIGAWNPTTISYSPTPIKIMDNVATADYSGEEYLVVKKDGSLWSLTGEEPAAKIMDDVKEVAAGRDHSMALKRDGTLWFWTTEKDPQFVKILDGVAHIWTDEGGSAAIKEDGTLWMWGSNSMSRVPSSQEENVLVPTQVLLPDVTEPLAPEETGRFFDVSPSDWYYDTVMDMVDKGAVNGFPDGTFGPEKPITMVELCKITQELLPPLKTSLEQYGAETVATVNSMLEEQNPGYWGNGVISDSLMAYRFADADIDFDGQLSVWTAPIDRAFLTRLIYQIYEKSAANAGAQMKIDADVYPAIGDYVTGGVAESDYLPHILWAYSNGLVGGVNENGDFNPGGQVSRAEACTILSRLLDPGKRLTINWTPVEAKLNAPLTAPGTGTDSFGNARILYAEDVAYEYARRLEERIGMRINYLPEFTEKSSSLFKHSDLAPLVNSPAYFQQVLLELHFLKESLDNYPDGLIKEVVEGKGSHATEIILYPSSFNGTQQYGVYIYDESNDAKKVDQIFYTGSGDVHFYTHEMGHMVMSAAAVKRGRTETRGQWEELHTASYADNGCVSDYAMVSMVEDWAETWAYLWTDPYSVGRQINAGSDSLRKKVELLTEMVTQYESVTKDMLPWSSILYS